MLPDDLGPGEEVLRAWGIPLRYAGPLDGPPPALERCAGLVVLGGTMNVDQIDQFPFLAQERELIRDAVAQRVPVLGICLGAQLLARSLGAAVRRAPHPELGFTAVRPTPATRADRVLGDGGEHEVFFQWHEDTFELPKGATLLLTGEVVTNQAFRVGQRAWGFQFHAEVTRPKLEAWFDQSAQQLRSWGRSREQLLLEADARLATQEARFRELFGRFVGLL